jgi:inosine triphosphate pyrophosphatase|tara:strand:- start:809 stop:1075 length:267 start_codon:yes stop_codon:yes gene_type:complete
MLERVGPEGLWNLCSRYEDRSCLVTCTLAAIDLRGGRFHWEESIKNARTFVGELVGCISGPPRGSVMHGKASWNSVFTPAGYDQVRSF